MDIEEAARMIVDAAIKVHRALGPGLLESAYQQCLTHELRRRGLQVECEVLLPIMYDGLQIDDEGWYQADGQSPQSPRGTGRGENKETLVFFAS